MNMQFEKIIEHPAVNKLLSDGVNSYRNMANMAVSNYIKRRNVGFKFGESVVGGIQDTKKYYKDFWSGKEPKEMVEAIIFED